MCSKRKDIYWVGGVDISVDNVWVSIGIGVIVVVVGGVIRSVVGDVSKILGSISLRDDGVDGEFGFFFDVFNLCEGLVLICWLGFILMSFYFGEVVDGFEGSIVKSISEVFEFVIFVDLVGFVFVEDFVYDGIGGIIFEFDNVFVGNDFVSVGWDDWGVFVKGIGSSWGSESCR